MTIRVAINGYGRIGRNILRAYYEYNKKYDMEIIAINDLGSLETSVHLTQFDTIHGAFRGTITAGSDHMIVNGDIIQIYAKRDPKELPWRKLGIDVVLECTGSFTSKKKATVHIENGAKKVIISAPGCNDIDSTIVFGINHATALKKNHIVISNASCTTNCLAPLLKPLNDALGLETGFVTTVHSYTNDQVLTDVHHKDLRRSRSATMNMIPTKTGAANAIGLVLPELDGKLDGYAIRVPTPNVSFLELSFIAQRSSSVTEVNNILQFASEGQLNGILGCTNKPLVSMDFNHNPLSSIADLSLTKVLGRLIQVVSWYDNEWAFANRMLDTTNAIMHI